MNREKSPEKQEQLGETEHFSDQPHNRESAVDSGEQNSQQQSVNINDENVSAFYSNFCRVSSTPEELILDLGLNPQPLNPENGSIKISQRVILNHYTAKRLLHALSMAVQRHENTFGVLETDIRRRVRST